MAKRALNRGLGGVLSAAMVGIAADAASAQSGSLYGAPEGRRPLVLNEVSWVYRQTRAPGEIRLHDIITVVVQEKQQVKNEGSVDRKKKANLNAVLSDWILFSNGNLNPSPQSDGDPKIKATLDSKFESDADLETRSSVSFRIPAEVVDIRPNGNLVLEAHKTVRNNEEVWEASLTGIVNKNRVTPAGTVSSEDIAELFIDKRERGHVYDGYRRGWFLQMLDKVQPF